jgi:hypothetical protein
MNAKESTQKSTQATGDSAGDPGDASVWEVEKIAKRPRTAGEVAGVKRGLIGGRLPKGCHYIRRLSEQFRRDLEASVCAIKGEVGISDAAAIQTAMRWERHALLAQRWMSELFDKLTPDQKLAFSRDIARASTERDKCIAALGLQAASAKDVWAALDAAAPKPELPPSPATAAAAGRPRSGKGRFLPADAAAVPNADGAGAAPIASEAASTASDSSQRDKIRQTAANAFGAEAVAADAGDAR